VFVELTGDAGQAGSGESLREHPLHMAGCGWLGFEPVPALAPLGRTCGRPPRQIELSRNWPAPSSQARAAHSIASSPVPRRPAGVLLPHRRLGPRGGVAALRCRRRPASTWGGQRPSRESVPGHWSPSRPTRHDPTPPQGPLRGTTPAATERGVGVRESGRTHDATGQPNGPLWSVALRDVARAGTTCGRWVTTRDAAVRFEWHGVSATVSGPGCTALPPRSRAGQATAPRPNGGGRSPHARPQWSRRIGLEAAQRRARRPRLRLRR
jgi:hypothetical protein